MTMKMTTMFKNILKAIVFEVYNIGFKSLSLNDKRTPIWIQWVSKLMSSFFLLHYKSYNVFRIFNERLLGCALAYRNDGKACDYDTTANVLFGFWVCVFCEAY